MGRIAHFLGIFGSDDEADSFVLEQGWSPADYVGMVAHNKEPGMQYKNSTTGFVRTWSGAAWVESGGASVRMLVTGSLNEAVNSVGTSKATLVVYRNTPVDAPLVVPSNIYLEFTKNGRLDIPFALTLNASFTGPSRRLFRLVGAGSIDASRSPTPCDPRWFGATGDAVTDDSSSITKALTSFHGPSTLPPGRYRTGSDLSIPVGSVLKSAGGVLVPDVATTITVRGRVSAAREQIFDCSAGRVLCSTVEGEGDREVWVEWFGATLDGVTDDIVSWKSAVEYLGTGGGVLRVGCGVTLIAGDDLTIPSGVVLKPEGVLKIADTRTVTIEGRVEAPTVPIFDCSLCVTSGGVLMAAGEGLGQREVWVEWFGANMTGSLSPASVAKTEEAWASALAAIHPNDGGIVRMGYGETRVSSTITVPRGTFIEGISPYKSTIQYAGVGTAVLFEEPGTTMYHGGLSKIQIECVQDDTNVVALAVSRARRLMVFRDVYVLGAGGESSGKGIYIDGDSFLITFDTIVVKGFEYGIYLDTDGTYTPNAHKFRDFQINTCSVCPIYINGGSRNIFSSGNIEFNGFSDSAIHIIGDGYTTGVGNHFSDLRIGDNDDDNPVCDSYDAAHQDDTISLDGVVLGVGQSFTGDGLWLYRASFLLRKIGAPVGDAYAKLYAHGGVFGTSSVPLGPALAVSNPLDVSTLTGSFESIQFSFPNDQKFQLVDGTHYVVTIEYVGGLGDCVQVGSDSSALSHAGNCSTDTGVWGADAAIDLVFSVWVGAHYTILLENACHNSFVGMLCGGSGAFGDIARFEWTLGAAQGGCNGNVFIAVDTRQSDSSTPFFSASPGAVDNFVLGSGRQQNPTNPINQFAGNTVFDASYYRRFPFTQTPDAFGSWGYLSNSDSAAIQDAVDFLAAVGGGRLELLPDKTYLISDDLVVPAGVVLVGMGGVLVLNNGKTVTVLGDIDCGAVQLFDLSLGGAVVLPADVVARPEWFGETTTVQTTDATVTTLVSHDIEDESAYLIEARVIARETDGSGRAVYGKVACVYRTGAGNATLQGAVGDLFADIESVGGWDVTIDVDGANAFRVRVTGAVGDTVDWSGDVRFRVLR